ESCGLVENLNALGDADNAPSDSDDGDVEVLCGVIIIVKETLPDGSAQSFEFDPSWTTNFVLTDGQSHNSGDLEPGTFDVSETVPTGWDLDSAVCDDGSLVSAISLQGGETVTCTFTNIERGKVEVVKFSSGVLSAGFDFEIRTGASTTAAGTVLESGTTDASGEINFSIFLIPGDTYQLCETGMMPGWSNDIDGFTPLGATPEGGDNSTECIDFTVEPGETKVFTVNNTPPPGGDARTIGFWKNWSSCTGGNQDHVLDETLASFAGGGVFIGDLFVNTCQEAFAILDKSAVNNGKKMSNDAAYNMAAQLLAAKLNVQAGAGTCAASTQAIADGQALLDLINFNGTGNYLGPKVKGAEAVQRALANAIGATLDAYNNNTLCP
ncbi:MAG: hypothetical protein WD557_16755, partial [Dehalococcoidia bacterium]